MRGMLLGLGALGLLIAVLGGTTAAVVTSGGDVAAAATPPAGFSKPVLGAVITQGFGCSPYLFEPRDPACPSGHYHSGIDLAAPSGIPVRATASGRVSIHVSAQGFGLYLVVDHGGGLSSLYGHLSSVAVSDGAQVLAGEPIGAVGSSGNSTGPHLHFEIRRDGIPENPLADLALP